MPEDIVRRPTRGHSRPNQASTPGGRPAPVGSPGPGPPESTPDTGNQVEQHRYDDLRNQAQAEALRLRSELDTLQAALPQARATATQAAADRVAGLRAGLAARADALIAESVQACQVHATELRSAIHAQVRDLAPGAASSPPNLTAALMTAEADDLGSRVPTHCLVGTFVGPTFAVSADEMDVPVVAPLWDQRGWYVRGDRDDAVELAVSAALRSVAVTPLKHLGIHVFDPRLSGAFGRLAPIRSTSATTFPTPSADASSFSERLVQVMDQANQNAENIGVAGRRTLGELWEHADLPEGRREVVVVLSYPYGVDARLQQQLERLAATQGRTGVSLIVCPDESATPATDVTPSRLQAELLPISVTGGRVEVPGYPSGVALAEPFSTDNAAAVVAAASARAADSQGPSIPLTRVLADDIADPWANDSASGLDILLGEARRQPLWISLRTQNPPHPNMLVGGAVGQGKSNLLLDVIYSLATRYPPEQLEMHLLDFKQGLEFARFAADADGRNWLPHVKVLSLESNLAFGVAVLRSIEAELDRRSLVFKRARASSIDDLRAGGTMMSRLLLIVDEFHMLFEGDDDLVDQSVEVMSRLAKQGRAFGIHLLLASQTISGIRSLATRGDAIFAQFPIRVSLKNTAQESQAILSQGNKAAAQLTYRGEVIVNRNYGGDPEGSNVRGTAAHAEDSAMADLQRTLWQRGHDAAPMMFVGTAFAPWEPQFSTRQSTRQEGIDLVVGRPIDVTTTPAKLTLESDADQGIAVVGPDAQLVGATLAAIGLSALPDLRAQGGEIVVLQGSSTSPPWAGRLQDEARKAGVNFSLLGRDEAAQFLRIDLATRLTDRSHPTTTLVIGHDLQRLRDMDAAPTDDSTDDNGSTDGAELVADDMWGQNAIFGMATMSGASNTGRAVLADAIRSGAMNGVYVAAHWSNVRTMEIDLGPGAQGVSRVFTAGLGAAEVKVLAGVTAAPPEGYPRVGFFDHGEAGLTTLIPYDLAGDEEAFS